MGIAMNRMSSGMRVWVGELGGMIWGYSLFWVMYFFFTGTTLFLRELLLSVGG